MGTQGGVCKSCASCCLVCSRGEELKQQPAGRLVYPCCQVAGVPSLARGQERAKEVCWQLASSLTLSHTVINVEYLMGDR